MTNLRSSEEKLNVRKTRALISVHELVILCVCCTDVECNLLSCSCCETANQVTMKV